MSSFIRSNAYPWALTGIFAALHLVITLIPFSLSVSGSGIISFGMVSASMVGFLLGPFFGTIAVLIGSFLAIFINPEIAMLGFATPIATAAGAFAAGLIRIKKSFLIPIFYIISILLYLISPIGPNVPELIWFHLIALILSLLFVLPKIKDKIAEEIEFGGSMTSRALFTMVIVAVTLDQLVGSTIGAYYLVYIAGFDVTLVTTWYQGATLIYPVERIIGALIIVFVLRALVESLSSGYFQLPATPFSSTSTSEMPFETEIET